MTKDLYINFLDGPPFPLGGLAQQEVDGVVKLAVQWLMNFMTEVGTDPHDLDRGTTFPRLIGSNIGHIDDVADVINLAVDQNNVWMYDAQADLDLPEDEQLQDARVVGVASTANGDGVEAVILVENALGQSVPIRIPAS